MCTMALFPNFHTFDTSLVLKGFIAEKFIQKLDADLFDSESDFSQIL